MINCEKKFTYYTRTFCNQAILKETEQETCMKSNHIKQPFIIEIRFVHVTLVMRRDDIINVKK